MNLKVVTPLAWHLYKSVTKKFINLLSEMEVPIPVGIEPLWKLVNPETGELYFDELIAHHSTMPYDYLYRKLLHESPKRDVIIIDEIGQEKFYDTLGFRDYYLQVLLDFLEVANGRVADRFYIFCRNGLNSPDNDSEDITEEIIKIQFDNIWEKLNDNASSQELEQEVYNDSLKESKKLRRIYIPKLKNTTWYFYFHENDINREERKEDEWLLVKLIFKFLEDQNGDIKVEIINTKDSTHNDYRGKTEFINSSDTILSIICKTYPFYSRLLNLRLNVGEGDGDLFLGQYLNQEHDNHIVSGSCVLEKIEVSDKDSGIAPKVYHIPKKDFYNDDYLGISRYIIQYLHDKHRNFRRTPFSKKYNIYGLAAWLEKKHKR